MKSIKTELFSRNEQIQTLVTKQRLIKKRNQFCIETGRFNLLALRRLPTNKRQEDFSRQQIIAAISSASAGRIFRSPTRRIEIWLGKGIASHGRCSLLWVAMRVSRFRACTGSRVYITSSIPWDFLVNFRDKENAYIG